MWWSEEEEEEENEEDTRTHPPTCRCNGVSGGVSGGGGGGGSGDGGGRDIHKRTYTRTQPFTYSHAHVYEHETHIYISSIPPCIPSRSPVPPVPPVPVERAVAPADVLWLVVDSILESAEVALPADTPAASAPATRPSAPAAQTAVASDVRLDVVPPVPPVPVERVVCTVPANYLSRASASEAGQPAAAASGDVLWLVVDSILEFAKVVLPPDTAAASADTAAASAAATLPSAPTVQAAVANEITVAVVPPVPVERAVAPADVLSLVVDSILESARVDLPADTAAASAPATRPSAPAAQAVVASDAKLAVVPPVPVERVVSAVPADYMTRASAIGSGKPAHTLKVHHAAFQVHTAPALACRHS